MAWIELDWGALVGKEVWSYFDVGGEKGEQGWFCLAGIEWIEVAFLMGNWCVALLEEIDGCEGLSL
jgi:hypothetical protein